MNVEEKNRILRDLSTKIGNRQWRIVEKTHEQESRELFCVPATTPCPLRQMEHETIWVK